MLIMSLAITNVGFAQAPRVYVDPATSVANPGDYFIVTIKVQDAPEIIAWQFKLRFDKKVLEFPPTVTEGGFLSSAGSVALTVSPNLVESYIHVGCHLVASGSASGDGNLAVVTFYVLESGVSDIILLEATLYASPDGSEVSGVTTDDGDFHSTVPFVDFTWTPYPAPEANETCTFDASACWDPDLGSITQYSWDFGDGTPVVNTANPIVNHTFKSYSDAGYPVNLTVTDDDAETWSKTKILRMWHEVVLADMWPSIVDNANPWWWFDTVDHTLSWEDQLWVLVTVINMGTYTEDLTVTLYADKNTSVIGDEEKMHWVWWDALDFAPTTVPPHLGSGWGLPFLVDLIYLDAGTWTLTAVVDPVPNEVNTANNKYTKQINLVAPPANYTIGDINFDHIVDIVDIISAVIGDGSWKPAFGSVPGDEVIYSEPAFWWVWHWKADINRDEIIDICDLVSIAVHFGEKW